MLTLLTAYMYHRNMRPFYSLFNHGQPPAMSRNMEHGFRLPSTIEVKLVGCRQGLVGLGVVDDHG